MRKFSDEQRNRARQIASPDAQSDNFVGRAILLILVAVHFACNFSGPKTFPSKDKCSFVNDYPLAILRWFLYDAECESRFDNCWLVYIVYLQPSHHRCPPAGLQYTIASSYRLTYQNSKWWPDFFNAILASKLH